MRVIPCALARGLLQQQPAAHKGTNQRVLRQGRDEQLREPERQPRQRIRRQLPPRGAARTLADDLVGRQRDRLKTARTAALAQAARQLRAQLAGLAREQKDRETLARQVGLGTLDRLQLLHIFQYDHVRARQRELNLCGPAGEQMGRADDQHVLDRAEMRMA